MIMGVIRIRSRNPQSYMTPPKHITERSPENDCVILWKAGIASLLAPK